MKIGFLTLQFSAIALAGMLLHLPLARAAVAQGHASAAPEANLTVPSMRAWTAKDGYLRFGPSSAVVVSTREFKRLRADADAIAKQLHELTGYTWPVRRSDSPRSGDVVLSIKQQSAPSAEAYTLTIDAMASIQASSNAGVFYGAQSLQQMLQHDPKRSKVAKGAGIDYPEFALRSVMIDIGRHYFEIAQIKTLMRDMAWKKLNTLHLHLTDWTAFRLQSAKFPGLAPVQSYSRADIDLLETTAASYHITIIPEIDLPAHATALIAYRPQLGFECPSMRQSPWLPKNVDPTGKAWTVDITKEANTNFIKTLLDEFIPWFRGPYFHIGGDEYQFDVDKNKCPELLEAAKKKGLPYAGDVMVDWINATNSIVKSHNKQTIIWSWWRFKDDKTSIEPDKDIIIDTWNAPAQDAIISAGYATILTPEDTLYVTPGVDGDHGADAYGLFNTKKVYEQYPFAHAPKVKGYQLSIWSDDAMAHTDRYLIGNAYEPMLVLAQRLWSGPSSETVGDFLSRANVVGSRLPSPWKAPSPDGDALP